MPDLPPTAGTRPSISVPHPTHGPDVRTRLLTTLLLGCFGTLILIPTWVILPPDDEGLFKEITATVFQSKALFSGHYPFWNPLPGFGLPQPLSQSLFFHPFILFAQFLPLGVAIGALYQLQIWIGVFSVWGVARHFGLGRSIGALCVITYGLSLPTIFYLHDFWPAIFVQWTLAPLLLLLLLKLLDADDRLSRATFAVAAGLCTALMLLDGHPGVLPDFAIGFIALLIGSASHAWKSWPWLLTVVGIFGLAGAGRIYDVAQEASRAGGQRHQDVASMDFWRLFLYPIGSPWGDNGYTYRALVIGGPFMVLTLVGLLHPGMSHRYLNGLRTAVVVSFGLWFLPMHLLIIRSANFYAADPFTIFAVFLAGLCLQTLWRSRPSFRPALAALALVQLVVLVAGFYPFYDKSLNHARGYLADKASAESLKGALGNQPIYAFLEGRPGIRETRTYMTPGAEDRLYRNLTDYEFAAWSMHTLRLVNGGTRGPD